MKVQPVNFYPIQLSQNNGMGCLQGFFDAIKNFAKRFFDLFSCCRKETPAIPVATPIAPPAISIQIQGAIGNMQQLQRALPVDARTQRAFQSAIQILSRVPLILDHSFDHHALHSYLTDITDAVRPRADLRPVWERTLQLLQGRDIRYTTGRVVPLETNFELARLNGNIAEYDIQPLDANAPTMAQDCEDIMAIDNESSADVADPADYLNLRLDNDRRRREEWIGEGHCLVARQRGTGRVIGYMVYMLEDNRRDNIRAVYVMDIARKAGAAKLGIAERLFDNLENSAAYRERQLDWLRVRASNVAAKAIYERRGYREVARHPFYQHPVEDAIEMARQIQQPARV